jgi:hypothetical protein
VEKGIMVTGRDVPPPVTRFEDAGFTREIQEEVCTVIWVVSPRNEARFSIETDKCLIAVFPTCVATHSFMPNYAYAVYCSVCSE